MQSLSALIIVLTYCRSRNGMMCPAEKVLSGFVNVIEKPLTVAGRRNICPTSAWLESGLCQVKKKRKSTETLDTSLSFKVGL